MIGVAALLQLVDWLHARTPRHLQGGSSCVNLEPPLSPPRPLQVTLPSKPNQLWLALPADNRAQLLLALSRVVAAHLAPPPVQREVTNEQA
jgi:hypothetical protein